jgi:6-pyruvoyltetrahydropterin/6-carboxytetrahydropterin synthase
MATVRLTKSFTFEMAHALIKYDGKCKNIHGHSYKLEVTVIGDPLTTDGHPQDGLVIDFGDLKKIVNASVINIYDHSLVMKDDYPNDLKEILSGNFERLEYVNYQPTCENLIADFADKIIDKLSSEVRLHHLVLHETATAYCEWYASDQD